jgi:tetratricopeptide (TPR) repeat protein
MTPSALDRAARAAMAQGDHAQAKQIVDRLLARHPAVAAGWLTASILALQCRNPAAAAQAAANGLAVDPTHAALLVQNIRCLHANGNIPAALTAAQAAWPLVRASPALLHELANACAALGDHTAALAMLREAAIALPNDPALNYNLATVLRYAGDFAEAEIRLDHAIRHAPKDWEAYNTRAQLRTQTTAHNHIAELEKLLAGRIEPWSGRVQLQYALAKEYEDLGEHESAFTHLHAGASLRRQHLRYDVAEDVAAMEAIQNAFGADYPTAGQITSPAPGPIFVFGLPRSGTTLVDRILSSHPAVVSLGELNDFPAAVIACAATGGPPLAKQALIKAAAALPATQIGAAYTARVAPRAAPGCAWIDKLPMNYLYAGLIAAALPNARLVHVARHPMASGYGMYKTLFHQGYPFSYDLDDLGRYIAAYLRLMRHWSHHLGDRLITISYESLVTDQPAQTRRLLESCGLDWNDACLTPERNPGPSFTQSAVQVRKPIYRDALSAWRIVAPQLAPLANRLASEGFAAEAA